jgi:hypothetical protein
MDIKHEFLRLYAAVRRGLREAQPWPTFFERFDLAKDWPSLERVSFARQVCYIVYVAYRVCARYSVAIFADSFILTLPTLFPLP